MAIKPVEILIKANTSGNAEVDQLANSIEQLAGTLEGDLKTSALASAAALRQLAQKDGAIQNFVDLKREAGQAATGLKDAQAAAQKLGAQLAVTETPTKKQTASLQQLRNAVRDAKTEVVTKTAALSTARGALAQYGISTDNLSISQRNVKNAIAAAKTEVQAMAPAWQTAAAGASASAGKQVQSAKQIESGLDSLKGQLNAVRNIAMVALGGSFIGSLAKDVAETSDEFKNLQSRIQLVTGEGPAFEASFDAVSAIALSTNSVLESTGTLFTRIAEAGKSAGLGTQDAIAQALALTETVNQAVQVSGASAQASDAAITQLIQGLQGGVLRGDEFNSVMEQAPRLAKALADGLSKTTGELREMAEAGQLSSETVIKALQGQSEAVASEFAKLPPTVGRAIQNLSTSWTLYVGETDKATGASRAAAGAISALANNLKPVANFLLDAGQAAAAFVAIKLAQHYTAMALAAVQATTAVVANTAAVTAAGAAGTTAAVGVGRFAAILSSLKLFSLLGIITNFHDIGTAIGEAAAKLMGYKDRTDELAAAEKVANQISADGVAQRKRMADATQDAIDKNFELGKDAKAAIAEFDKLTKAGESSAAAVAKIGKDFDLGTLPGIVNATAVLDKLAADGKISATAFQQAWGDALKGADLAVFETNARTAFAGTARETERLAQILDATLRESIKRTGLDFEVISGGMSKASISAINDTQAMIDGLDRLKLMGVDTAQVLSASIGKSIDTADSEAALERLRAQIEQVRTVLGDQIADGLLDQATAKATGLKDALDKALPGINSVAEAMKTLGVTSDQTFADTAAKSTAAYDAMKASGLASARELTDAFKKYAADVIAANGGVASEALKAEGAMRGVEVAVDSAGRAIVKNMGEAGAAVRDHRRETDGLTGSYRALADAAYEATSAIGKLQMARSAAAAADGQFLVAGQAQDDAKRADAMATSEAGRDATRQQNNASQSMNTLSSIIAFLKSAGVADADAQKIAKEFADSNGNIASVNNSGQLQYGGRGSTMSSALYKAAEQYKYGYGATNATALGVANRAAQTGQTDQTRPAKTYTVTINWAGQATTINTSSDADAQALIALLQRAKLSA